MTFTTRSEGVARRFLQTVLVFDDRAEFVSSDVRTVETETPGADRPDPETDDFGSTPSVLTAPVEPQGPGDETGVDAKRLSDSFAELGLICGLIKPAGHSDVSLLLGVAGRADIVVLDWVINEDGGAAAEEIVLGILAADQGEEQARLRLVAIYTSQRNLDEITDRLADALGRVGEVTRAPFVVDSDATRVVVLAKESSAASGDAASQRVSYEELPERLIREFAALTTGLVPNVVLAGLSAVRVDTHRILQRLNRDLDPAYVGQRILLETPDEARDQLVELLTSELHSVMEDRDVGLEAGLAAIEEWVASRLETDAIPRLRDMDPQDTRLLAVLKDGLYSNGDEAERFRSVKGVPVKQAHKYATQLFTQDEETAKRADDLLAMRFLYKTHYGRPDRVLQLGTVVRTGEQFLLCVQPVCDSVRISGARAFPFVPLDEKVDKYNFIAPQESDRLPLQLATKPFDLQVFHFEADAQKQYVLAKLVGATWMFTDVQGNHYAWFARLQTSVGQDVVHRIGSEFGRVGLSQSEWLRRTSK